MGPKSFGVLLCILLLTAFATADDEASIDISVSDGDVELTVDLPNPCEGYECPGGEVCQVVVHPTLLQLPVAHCVENEIREEGPCHEYAVGSNVMNCKTEDQWRAVGENQCSLRGTSPSILTQTQVQHACHSYQPGDQTKFLSATFTCCPVGYKSSTPPPTSHPQPSHPDISPSHPPEHHETVTYQRLPSTDIQPNIGNRVGEGAGEGEEVEEEAKDSTYYVPVVLGVVMLAALALVTLAVLQRCHRKRSIKSPPEPATCYINPSSEGWGEGGGGQEKDTSLLITNKSFSSGK